MPYIFKADLEKIINDINNSELNDKLILEKVLPFVHSEKQLIKSRYKLLSENIKKYIENRFIDSTSFKETIFRFKNNIIKKPKCKMCDNNTIFMGNKFSKYCSRACCNKDPEKIKITLEKQRKYNLEHYGVKHNLQRKECVEKQKQTMINKYGSNKMSELGHKEKINKTRQEKIKEFGSKEKYNEYLQNKKVETIKEKYGIETWSDFVASKEIQEKINKTKKERHTFNTSSFQQFVYNKIKEIYPNTKQEYNKDSRYPWKCDIYIPDIDTFIEIQGFYSHGGHPYNPNDKNDIIKVKKWKSTGRIGAINVWTVTDPLKRETAKKNNLNYFEFFTLEDFIKWLKSIGYEGEIKFKRANYKNIEQYLEIPKCPICGKDCKRREGIHFCKTCGDTTCARKLNRINGEKTTLERYGVKNIFQLKSTIEKAQQGRIKHLKKKF